MSIVTLPNGKQVEIDIQGNIIRDLSGTGIPVYTAPTAYREPSEPPPIPDNVYNTMRTAVQSGAFGTDPVQASSAAKVQLQNMITSRVYSGRVDVSKLFPPGSSFDLGGKTYQWGSGSQLGQAIRTSALSFTTNISPSGITTSSRQRIATTLGSGATVYIDPVTAISYDSPTGGNVVSNETISKLTDISTVTDLSTLLSRLIRTGNNYTDTYSGKVYSANELATMFGNSVASAIVASGKTVNPNISDNDLSLVTFKDFMTEAESAISPYYASQFNTLKSNLATKFQELSSDLTIKRRQLEEESSDIRQQGQETLAGRGLTFSGQRTRFDTRQTQTLQDALNAAETSTYRTAQEGLQTAESNIGTTNLSGIPLPSYGGRTLSFSTTPVKGTYEYQQSADIFNRAQALAAAENARRQYAWNTKKNSTS
jgi:hypothetical protein